MAVSLARASDRAGFAVLLGVGLGASMVAAVLGLRDHTRRRRRTPLPEEEDARELPPSRLSRCGTESRISPRTPPSGRDPTRASPGRLSGDAPACARGAAPASATTDFDLPAVLGRELVAVEPRANGDAVVRHDAPDCIAADGEVAPSSPWQQVGVRATTAQTWCMGSAARRAAAVCCLLAGAVADRRPHQHLGQVADVAVSARATRPFSSIRASYAVAKSTIVARSRRSGRRTRRARIATDRGLRCDEPRAAEVAAACTGESAFYRAGFAVLLGVGPGASMVAVLVSQRTHAATEAHASTGARLASRSPPVAGRVPRACNGRSPSRRGRHLGRATQPGGVLGCTQAAGLAQIPSRLHSETGGGSGARRAFATAER